jgi:hypothetical protein
MAATEFNWYQNSAPWADIHDVIKEYKFANGESDIPWAWILLG